MHDFDVIIVGAGPAGCIAANVLKESGCNFALIEKFSSPRKVCGGLLCEETLELLDSFNIAPPSTAFPTALEIKDLDNGIDIDTGRTLLSVERRGFDSWLRDIVRDKIIFDRVVDIIYGSDNGKITILTKHRKLRARYLIGADGVNSIVRAKLGKKMEKSVLIQFKLKGKINSTTFIFDSNTSRTYYSYLIPKKDYILAGTKYEDRDSPFRLLSLLKKLGQKSEVIGSESHPIVDITSLDDLFLGEGNVILAGEAAGFVSPSSGEGISFAIESGIVAAKSVLESLESGETLCDVYQKHSRRILERLTSRIEKAKKIFNPESRRKRLVEVYGVGPWA